MFVKINEQIIIIIIMIITIIIIIHLRTPHILIVRLVE